MSTLPRNVRAKNRQAHLKNDSIREASKKIAELDSICQRHKVGDLSFRSCKFSTAEGVVSYVDYTQIKANLRSSIMIVKSKSIETFPDTVYDIVQIKNDKLDRDRKKKLEEEEKALAEIEKLKKREDNEEIAHQELLKNLDPEPKNNTEVSVEVNADTEVKNSSLANVEEKTEPADTDDKSVSSKKRLTRREKALRQLRNQLAKKNKPAGNKYYRNFMRDLKSKFQVIPLKEITYLEVKADASDMVIADVGAYEILMPSKIVEKYYLFIGDLQMKSGLIRTIDPAFESDKIMDEQTEFLERIKAKEKTVTYEEEGLESESEDSLESIDSFSDVVTNDPVTTS